MHACTNGLSVEHLPKPPVFVEAAPPLYPQIEVQDPCKENHDIPLLTHERESRIDPHQGICSAYGGVSNSCGFNSPDTIPVLPSPFQHHSANILLGGIGMLFLHRLIFHESIL